MKTEQEIKEWIETHNLQTSTINAIRGFIHGAKLNISDVFPCETADYVGKSDTFEDFIEWFNSEPKKEFGEKHLGEPQMLTIKMDVEPVMDMLESFKKDLEHMISVPKPKFKVNDKVVRKGKGDKVFEVKKILPIKKNSIRYLCVAEDGTFMHGVRESKLEAYVEGKCPFQVGQWVRNKENNKVFQVDAVFNSIDGWVIRECPYLFHFAERLEEYVPKEGEFFVSKCDNTFISYSDVLNKKDEIITPYCYCIDTDMPEKTFKDNITPLSYNLRPASEEEKQLLIKKVEEKFNQTWDEEKKVWVDVPNKFKAGDYAVVVRKGTWFHPYGFMDYLVGKTIKIQSVSREGSCTMEPDNITNKPWRFNPLFLRPATVSEILQYQTQELQKYSINEDIVISKHPQFGFTVTKGKNKAEQIRYGEMLGLVSALTMPEPRPDFAVDWKG